MTAVDTFAQYCQDSLPNCPIPLLRRLVIEGAREFCKGSKIWTLWIPTATIADGTADYDLTATLPANSVIQDLAHVKVQGFDILPYSKMATTPATDQTPYWSAAVPGNFSDFCGFQNVTYNRANVGTVTLVPVPSGMSGMLLDVQMILMPSPTATTLLDVIYNEWLEAIEAFVKWKAMTRPPEPGQAVQFSSPEMGMFHKGEWLEKLGDARVRVQAGNMTPRHRNVPADFT